MRFVVRFHLARTIEAETAEAADQWAAYESMRLRERLGLSRGDPYGTVTVLGPADGRPDSADVLEVAGDAHRAGV